jgi:beta-lactam-binding protein with PASTA domain
VSTISGKGERQQDLQTNLPVLALMVLVLIVAGLLSAMTAMRFAIRGSEVEVPNLIGLTERSANRILVENGLTLTLDGRRFSEIVPESLILAQTPEPGSSVKRDRSVRVLLSLGPRQYAVPDLGGSSLRSSQLLLNQRGLSVGNTLYSHTDSGEASTVVFQTPEAGDLGAADPAVDILVSLGSSAQYFVMPRLIGLSGDEIITRIRRAGFRLGEVVYSQQSGVDGGLILSQQPSAGYRISRNDIISLEVSQ